MDTFERPAVPPAQHPQLTVEDFWAYLPLHRYLHIPTGEAWPAASVNGALQWPLGADGAPCKPSEYLDRERSIEQMIWAPGCPQVIRDKLLDQGGWVAHAGSRIFNLYKPPLIATGDASRAGPWRDHLRRLYPDEADHIEKWCAHRVQFPGTKINHALVLGGGQGIGKDTLLEPLKYAVGSGNWSEISPAQMLGRFNAFLRSVIVRVSETRDLGEHDRIAFYDHSKTFIAAPPDVLRVDEKNIREYCVMNVLGLVITTNHKTGGIYLPTDDRRHFVAWSEVEKSEFSSSYWNEIWSWYRNGGMADVAAYLRSMDLTDFDPKAPPPHTPGFHSIVHAHLSQDDSELLSLTEMMGTPDALTIPDLCDAATRRNLHDVLEFLRERRHRRQLPYALERAGYIIAANPYSKDGRWKINGYNTGIYARVSLPFQHQLTAARERSQRPWSP